MKHERQKGHIILLTGISGSGKTTLGRALKDSLARNSDREVEFIDGGEVRNFLEIDSKYTPEERFLVTKQIAYAAHLLANHGVDVIVANIAGASSTRDYLRRKWGKYIQIFLDADINDCIRNDPNGVYKTALASKTPSLCGIDLKYERPRNPDLTVYTHKESVKQSLDRVIGYLREKGFFNYGKHITARIKRGNYNGDRS